ncbi:MAG: hypothetical protein M0042_07045 [Nitrospiraceae bacterium]|nr:hypothetical protein [Nitrospiraceae bacterium]
MGRFSGTIAAFFLLWLCSASFAYAEDLDLINRPVNTSGLTGLLYTTSPFTMPARSVEIGLTGINENSLTPNYSLTEYAILIAYGIDEHSEMAVRPVYWYRNMSSVEKSRGVGDTQLSYKRQIIPQPENSRLPAVAVLSTLIIPTADRTAAMNSVQHWGASVGLSVGSEINWAEHVVGVYGDAEMTVQDLSDTTVRDRFYTMNAGVVFPISKFRNLQMFVEYSEIRSKDVVTVEGANYHGTTYGLRLVSQKFNMSFGTQFLHRNQEGYSNSNRIAGLVSYTF